MYWQHVGTKTVIKVDETKDHTTCGKIVFPNGKMRDSVH